jgi:hypothetical protein
MLHGSAVCLEGGLILFIGDSGSGKSTLAGSFHQAGHWALSDDCVWLKEMDQQVVAVPSYGGLRLWEDSLHVLFASGQATRSMAHYSDKQRVSLYRDAGPKSGAGLPVLAVIVLTPPDQKSAPEVKLNGLPGRETFIAMLKQTFQLDLMDLHRMTRHAEKLARIVPRVPAYSLSMPRNYDLLPLARQKILEAVL